MRKELYVHLYYAVEYVIIYDLIKLGNQKRNKRLKRRPDISLQRKIKQKERASGKGKKASPIAQLVRALH